MRFRKGIQYIINALILQTDYHLQITSCTKCNINHAHNNFTSISYHTVVLVTYVFFLSVQILFQPQHIFPAGITRAFLTNLFLFLSFLFCFFPQVLC